MTRAQRLPMTHCIYELLIFTLAIGVAALPTQTCAQSAPQSTADVASRPFAAAAPRGDGPLFESLTPGETGVDFQMRLPDPRLHIREFTLLSVFGGVCSGDYDGDGLVDFYVTSPVGGNRLYKNLGDFRFRDVTVETGVQDAAMQSSGATFVDVDGDGDLDIYACAYGGRNRLFVNQGPGPQGVRFVEQARRFGLDYNGASMTMAFADIDGDGDVDGYLATTATKPPPGVQFSVHFEGNKPIVDESVREYWELIYLPGGRAQATEAGQYDHLYRNDGGHFADISKEAGIDGPHFTLSATWWDYNNDGRPDLYASNDFIGPDRLYRNEGEGRFTNVAAEALPHSPWFSMGTDVADVNNDGRVDLLATDMSARKHARRVIMSGTLEKSRPIFEFIAPRQELANALYLSFGGSSVLEAARQYGIDRTDWTWNPRFADFDNDGFVDLYVTTGSLRDTQNADLARQANDRFAPGSEAWRNFWANKEMYKEPNVAFKNREGRAFDDVGAEWGLDRVGVSYGAVTADFDNDGDLDLVVNNADAPLSIYRNNAGGRSIRVELRGRSSNRFGLGATVTLEVGDRRQSQYLTLARGWLSAIEPAVHFGLSNAERVDALTVRWPSGHVQRLESLAAGRTYTVTESATADAPNPAAMTASTARPMFTPAPLTPPIVHDEEPYDDFAAQPLLPYRLSQPGPAIAWADVDGDGDQDAFLGGSRARPSRMLLNNDRGSLDVAWANFAELNLQNEAAAACFLDVDGDGDQDLYVATGSVEHPQGDSAYRDVLYLNDGQGKFARAPADQAPDLRDSGSVAAAADFDQDGDVDLFVGSRSVPGAYPTSPENRLLANDGGKFHDVAPDALRRAGMVTDAVWADADGDGWLDLVATTDWGPVRLFVNRRGKLEERTEEAGLSAGAGWWLAVAPGDFDADGDVDFVVTNIGRNTPYRATTDAPLGMYYGDVEGLGAPRIIETVVEDGVCYPRREFGALQFALPTLSATYKSFAEFSMASVDQIVGVDRLRHFDRFEARQLDSGILINDGGLKFHFAPLPDLAQLAPAADADVADLNGDGKLDIVLAQNLYTFTSEVGRFDGGLGLVLFGNGAGGFHPARPDESGVVVPRQARHVKAVDLDRDGRPDLVFGVQGPLTVFHNGPAQ